MPDIETSSASVMPMNSRSPNEAHRGATPLELFFDVVFIVAVGQAASALHHGIADDNVIEALVSYSMAFFAIWLAWMNFTWFASSYDNGDIPYRLLVFVQITGALIIASGIEPLFIHHDFTVIAMGYIVMRVAHVTQLLRFARLDVEHRPAALRFAMGTSLAQLGWVFFLILPNPWKIRCFIVGALIELSIPVWAERASPTSWHPQHIRERYGLFTIIVLGESILSTSLAIQSVSNEGSLNSNLITTIIGGLLIVYSMWWLYFYQPADYLLVSFRDAFTWGYSHLLIFEATAAVGVGLAVVVDQVTHHIAISAMGAGMTVALPISIYIITLWILHEHPQTGNVIDKLLHPIIVVLILLTPFTGQAVLLIGILLVFLVALRRLRHLD